MQLDEHKAPVSAPERFYCSAGSRSAWYLEAVSTLLFHTDGTLILSGPSWRWRHQGSTSQDRQRRLEGAEKINWRAKMAKGDIDKREERCRAES